MMQFHQTVSTSCTWSWTRLSGSPEGIDRTGPTEGGLAGSRTGPPGSDGTASTRAALADFASCHDKDCADSPSALPELNESDYNWSDSEAPPRNHGFGSRAEYEEWIDECWDMSWSRNMKEIEPIWIEKRKRVRNSVLANFRTALIAASLNRCFTTVVELRGEVASMKTEIIATRM